MPDVGSHLDQLTQPSAPLINGSTAEPIERSVQPERAPRPLARTGPLSLEQVASIEALEALGEEYERLNRVTDNGLPFALREWHVGWCRQWLNCNPRVRDELAIHVLRDGAGICVALIPMLRSVRTLGPLRVCTLNMLGPDRAITEIHPSLVEPGFEAPVAAAIQRHLSASADWDWVNWNGLSPRFATALAAHAPLAFGEPQRSYVLDLPRTWAELRARLKRNIRESLRHCYNSLRRDSLRFQVAVRAESGEIAEALERFFELHALRAQLSGVPRHPDHFGDESSRAFLRETCAALAERNVPRVFELIVGEEVVASRIGFVVGQSLYMYYSGFAPRWARYSVTTTILAEAIKYAIGCGLKALDLSPTRNVSKTRWSPREILYERAVQFCEAHHERRARLLYELSRGEGAGATVLTRLLRPFKRQHD
jgi:CelD/BcsL family acetyltransferase involved in cellulose biosynthesis